MRMTKQFSLLLLMCIALGGLSGCSAPWETTEKVGKVLWDPSTPAGKEGQQASEIAVTLLAEPDINLNEDGEATPVEIQLVYLSEDSRFEAMDFDQLENDELPKILGKNYIDHQDYTLLPGQYKPLSLLRIDKENRYLGIIVRYSDPNISQWKKVIKLNGTGRHYYLLAHIKADEVELRKEEEE